MSRTTLVLTLFIGGLPIVAAGQARPARSDDRQSATPSVVVEPQSPLNTYAPVDARAATVQGDWDRAKADMIRSYGMYLYLRGQGAIGWEQARDQYIRNRQAAQEAWFELKRRNHHFRFPQRPNAVISNVVDGGRKASPQRLSMNELGPDGRIYWPDLLMAKEFGGVRKVLDELFRSRASGVPAGGKSAIRKAIADETANLQAVLSSRIREFSQTDYTAARKFIEKLRYEARFDSPVALTRR